MYNVYSCFRYFYTEAFEVTKENVFDSLHLATRFELIHLEKQCEELMCSNLSAQNFVSILNTACDFQSPVLIARCVKYFEDNTAKVFQNRNTDLLQREALQHLLEWCQKLTGASEAELLQMVWRWGRAGLRKARHTAITARVDVVAYLGDLLRHIQFLHMPVQDFASYVTSKNIFPKEKEIEMFCYLAQPDAMRTSDLSQEQLQVSIHNDRLAAVSDHLCIRTTPLKSTLYKEHKYGSNIFYLFTIVCLSNVLQVTGLEIVRSILH